MTLPTLEALGVVQTSTKTDLLCVFKSGESWITKQSAIFARQKPSVTELQYMVGKSAWEAIQDAAFRQHGDAYRQHLPEEEGHKQTIESALKRAAELQPDYFPY